jgi:prevent-host-death family protein
MASSTTTETMKISDVRSELNSLVNRVHRGEARIIVEKSGIPVAVLVSPEELNYLKEREKRIERGWEAMRQISRAFADVPVEELEAKVSEIIAENRAQARAEREAAASVKK